MKRANLNNPTAIRHPLTKEFGTVIRKDGTLLMANDHFAQNQVTPGSHHHHWNIFDLLPDVQGATLRTLLCRVDQCKSSQVSMGACDGQSGCIRWEVIRVLPADAGTAAYLCLGRPWNRSSQRKNRGNGQLDKCKSTSDHAAQGVLLQDKGGRIVWANEKAARLLNVAGKALYQPHFLEQLWKTYHCIDQSVPLEHPRPSASGKPGLLPVESTLVIKRDRGGFRTLSLSFEGISGSGPFPSFGLTRIRKMADAQETPASSKPHGQDSGWIQRSPVEQAVDAAIKGERERIGHELHDNVNQMLSVTRIYLTLLHPDDPDEKEIRDKAEHILQMAIEELRSLSHGLVKSSAVRQGLIEGIRGLVDDVQHTRLFNITFTCNSPEIESLDQAKKVALYRIVQEQLNNIIKYSHAKNVHIQLGNGESGACLSVEDDGIGFNKLTVQKGIGLKGIYKKAEQCNGSVELQTSPGQGCVLRVTAITAAAS